EEGVMLAAILHRAALPCPALVGAGHPQFEETLHQQEAEKEGGEGSGFHRTASPASNASAAASASSSPRATRA
ncbi:hypothetical protein EX84_15735, partial [Staphylococcus aureus]